jgi:hypothetical protein
MTTLETKVALAVADAQYATAPGQEQYNIARAVLSALGADETRHKVLIQENTYTIEHPIRERLEGSLMDCEVAGGLHQKMQELYNEYGVGLFWVSYTNFQFHVNPVGD